MNLNKRSPKASEERRKNREHLEAYAIGVIRKYLSDEMSDIAPAEWSQEMRGELIDGKTAESKRVIEALTTSELEDEFELQRHGERAVAEMRMKIHRQIRDAQQQR